MDFDDELNERIHALAESLGITPSEAVRLVVDEYYRTRGLDSVHVTEEL